MKNLRSVFVFTFLFIGSIISYAQGPGQGYVRYVSSAPVGSCSQYNQVQIVQNTGAVYSCQFGVWNTASIPAGVTSGSVVASQGNGKAPVFQTKNVIDVRDYGVKCDGVTNDSTAMNSALAAAVAVGTTTGTAWVQIPAGICIGNFSIVQGKGLKIQGAGELSTHLRSPNSSPAMTVNGLWYSSFADLTIDTRFQATNAVFELDGDWDGVHTLKVQFVTFQNVLVAGRGTTDGLLSTYATALCRQGGSNCQGSNVVFINSAMSGASTAVYFISGYNALGDEINNGDFQDYTLDGIYVLNGNVSIIGGTTFETGSGCAQLINGGWDVHTSGGSFPVHVISSVRSEGWNLFNTPNASIDSVSQSPAWATYAGNAAFALNAPVSEIGADGLAHLYCVSTAGTTAGSPPVWPTSGTVADGTVVWTEHNYNAINTPGWYNSTDSHLDATASLNWPGWSSVLGYTTVDSTGLINGGVFDRSSVAATTVVEHTLQNTAGIVLDLFVNPDGASHPSTVKFIATLPAQSSGLLARGGVRKLYLGDGLYEGTEGGQPATAQYHVTAPQVNFDGLFGASATGPTYSVCETAGAPTVLATGATTTTTGLNCLPANSIIDAVVARVTTTITASCTGWELGDGSTAARFSSNNTTLTSGTTTDAAHIGTFNNTGIASATTGIWQAAASKITITCAGGNPGAGAIRIIVYYHTWTAPTS